jgi:nitrogen regulatory protein P-II 1
MKHLVLIIHANLKRDVADLLRSIESIDGFTLTNIEGHDAQSENDPFLSTRDKVVGYTPRMRVDVLLEDTRVAGVLAALRKSDIGLHTHSIYWVTNVEEHGQL